MTRRPALRSTRSTAPGASRSVGGGDLDALRKRLSRHRDDDEPRPPREKRPITIGRVLKWVAIAVASLAPAVARPVPDQRADPGGRLARDRARAVEQGQPLQREQHPRARLRRPEGRLDRRVPVRPRPLRHDHARPRRLRQRAQALDPARRRGERPRPRRQQGERRLRARRRRAHDPDARGVPRQRARGEPRGRGRLRGVPRLHRLARRNHGRQQDARLLAAVRQLLEGHPLQEGRDRPRRPARARLRARPQEHLRARRGRPRSRPPPAAGARGDRLPGEVAEHVRRGCPG